MDWKRSRKGAEGLPTKTWIEITDEFDVQVVKPDEITPTRRNAAEGSFKETHVSQLADMEHETEWQEKRIWPIQI